MTRYRIPHGVLRAEVRGEEVLLDQSSGTYHLVNETGRLVLGRIAVGDDFDALVEVLAAESGQSVDRVRGDVAAFIATMTELKLIEATGDG